MCDHDERFIVEDPASGMVCTQCGAVLEFMSFDTLTFYEQELPSHHTLQEDSGMTRVERHIWKTEKDPDSGLTAAKLKTSAKVIAEVCNALSLNDRIRSTACELHAEVLRLKEPHGGFRGQHFKTSAASAVYFACIIHHASRGEVEFAANADVSRSALTTTNKIVRRLLSPTKYGALLHPPINPAHLTPRFVAALVQQPPLFDQRLGERVRGLVESLLMDDTILSKVEGRTPECICAAACTLAIERVSAKCDRKEVSKRCGVSLASINAIIQLL